jgi:hypothetical protein
MALNKRRDNTDPNDRDDAPWNGGQVLAPFPPRTNILSLDPDLLEQAKQDAGKGLSQRPDDNLIPMITILQAQSPSCNSSHPSHVEGAEAGMFLLKNSPVPLVSGRDGFGFVPAAMELVYNEWRQRSAGGGFIAKHTERPADVKEIMVPDPLNPASPPKRRLIRPNGNEIIETRIRYGLASLNGLGPIPFALPFTGAGHTVCRSWETTMNALTIPGTADKPYPAFAGYYRLRTRQRTNSSGTWFQLDFNLERAATKGEYFRAKALCEAFEAALVSADVSQMNEEYAGSGSTEAREDVPF